MAMFHKAADVIGVDMKDIRIYEDSIQDLKMHMMPDADRLLQSVTKKRKKNS